MTPEQFLQRVKEGTIIPRTETSTDLAWVEDNHRTRMRLVRGWELQRAVIEAQRVYDYACAIGTKQQIIDRKDVLAVAKQDLAAFEKEMENWT